MAKKDLAAEIKSYEQLIKDTKQVISLINKNPIIKNMVNKTYGSIAHFKTSVDRYERKIKELKK